MKVRTIFLSDVHLGTRGCQAEMLLDFLTRHESDRLYLVGDIIDGWKLGRGWFWKGPQNDVIEAVLAKARAGCKVIYIPGNHDEALRHYPGTHFGGIEVRHETCHVTADGRRLLVTHGDQFDSIVVNARWLAHLGDRAYDAALWCNTRLNRLRRLWGGQYWSLSNWAKQQVKQAVNFISEYEKVLTAEARRGGYDGVVCGHIHAAAMRRIGDLDYVNTGDWVESCTAVVEHPDGRLQLIDWAEEIRARAALEADRKVARIGRARRGSRVA
ncbi:UDP-2,3-diacylglucosamine diphosphatase [Roseivivax isoporae]|uniref:Ser/threonine protein phosphatase n=1 Tax=Roseivivax isoporae LMG 25204 TaxID=1449351 RepID=X7FDY5_9RHOB|nr:UDP-2,3-diacylglucosamine diphosphatase [Roseivivax isoporae]ETX30259.1 ser/threonine protein phosphatase [Roseivivax isoporae LMG 25204]